MSIDFSAMVADRHHASKMRPHIIRRSDRRWRTRERLLHLFGDRPRSHTSPSAALGIRTIISGAVVVERGVHRALGVFLMRDGDRPPWPENRSTSSKMALFGHFWGPNSRTKPKPRHLVGEKIILTLLTNPMHREIISHRVKWAKFAHRNYSFRTL